VYREPHLTIKEKECAIIWEEWYEEKFNQKNYERAKILRRQWSQCCDELTEMINQEYLTNPRYNNLRM
jgi:hypothetical protein